VADNYTDTPASASSMAGSYTDTPAGEEPKEQCNCTCGGARCLQVMRRLHLRRGRCVACSYLKEHGLSRQLSNLSHIRKTLINHL
jgi:hypothetical protein